MKLIDTEALKKAIDTIKQTGYDTDNKPLFEYVELPDLIKAIDNAPTAIAVDFGADGGDKTIYARPQGEWKTNLTTGDIFCSCCKEVRRDTRINHINFCNSCGADMRKGEEE